MSDAVVAALRSAGHAVTVLGYARPGQTAGWPDGSIVVAARPIESDRAGLRKYLWLAQALAQGRPYSVQKYAGAGYRQALQRLLAADPGALVVVDHAQSGHVLAQLRTHPATVFLAHNVEAALYAEQARGATGPGRWIARRESRRMQALECQLVQACAQVWALTDADATHFRALGAHAVQTLDVALAPTAPARPGGGPDLAWDVGLIGTWSWAANAEGLRWFVDRVRPLLGPGVRVAVAGRGADEVQQGIHRVGFVPDAQAFMQSCRVVCVPSVAGAGIQIKTLDAIACGRPVVATGFAVRGIRDLPASAQCADTPEAFAAAVLQALQQPGNTLDGRGPDWARARASRFQQQLVAALARLPTPPGA
ncbi:MAG: glycosyltransferase family 4 protein [Pseudomonadota bacterium]